MGTRRGCRNRAVAQAELTNSVSPGHNPPIISAGIVQYLPDASIPHLDASGGPPRRPRVVRTRHSAGDRLRHVRLRAARRRVLRLWRDRGPGVGADRGFRLCAARRALDAGLCAAHHDHVLPRPRCSIRWSIPTTRCRTCRRRCSCSSPSCCSAACSRRCSGLLRLGTLIKFAPHPVMAGFQNMAAVLLFLVQLGNVLGYDRVIGFTHVHRASGGGAAAERAGRARHLRCDVARAQADDEDPAAPGRSRHRHRRLLRPRVRGLCATARPGHRAADRERRGAQRAGRLFPAVRWPSRWRVRCR